MKSYSLKLWRILQGVKSANPAQRFKALAALSDLKEKPTSPKVLMLLKMVKEAAGVFPKPVDIWDDPSYHLLRFASDFRSHDIAKSMIEHYKAYSPFAKSQVIRYLCNLDGEKYRVIIRELAEESFRGGESVILPLDALFEEPLIVKSLVEKFYQKIEEPQYKNYFYRMLLFCLTNGSLFQFKPDFILPILAEDYQKLREEYLEYDGSYSPKFVYNNWKEGYLAIRDRLGVLISLIEFYFTNETTEILKEALTFRDPHIQTKAAIVSLQKQMAVDEKTLLDCAMNIETTEMLYWELLRINKDHLFPIKKKKQSYFARSHLFNFVIDNSQYLSYPEEIEVVDQVDTENYYGQKVRYYFIAFKQENEPKLAWVGAYSIDEGPDSIYMWEGTYIDEHELSDYSLEEHKQIFLNKREVRKKDDEEVVAYRSRPPFWQVNRYLLSAYCLFTIAGWYGYFSENDRGMLGFAIKMTVVGALYLAWRTTFLMTNGVEVKTHTLIYRRFKQRKEVQIHHIQKILVRKEPFWIRFLLRKAQSILVYNEKNEIVMKIPANCVDYEQFSENIHLLTTHLSEQPYIDKAS